MKKRVSQLQALLLALAAFTFWSLYDTGIKFTAESHVPTHEILGFVGFFSSMIIWGICLARRQTYKLRPKNKKMVLLRSSLCAANALLNVLAFPLMPLTNFYVTVFTSPFFIAILATIFLNESISWQKAAIIFVGFMGVLIAMDPVALIAGQGNVMGYAYALCSVLSFSITQVMLRSLSQTETFESLLFTASVFLFIVGVFMSLGSFAPISLETVFILFISSALSVTAGILMVVALKNAPAATIAPCHYWQIIPGALLGYFIWHNTLSWNLVLGALIIIGSGLAFSQYTRKQQAPNLI